MNGVFVDTSGWYAMIDRKDNSHQTARYFIQKNRLPLVTTNYVMDETVTLLLIRLGHSYAVRFLDSLQISRMVQLVYLNPAQIEATIDLFRNRPDKG